MSIHKKLRLHFVLCALASTTLAHAQSLEQNQKDLLLPYDQVAATDSSWSLQSNPAGLAFVDTLELTGGYAGTFNRSTGPRHNLLLQGGLTPFAGLSLGLGGQYTSGLASDQDMRLQTNFAIATRIGHGFSAGAQIRTQALFHELNSPRPLRIQGDLGMQFRPLSFMSVGLVAEDLGGFAYGNASAVRLGISLRPFVSDLLTLGADMRVRGGGPNIFKSNTFTDATLSPTLHAKMQAFGIAVYGGATLENPRLANITDGLLPSYRINGGLEVNTGHLGALLVGGYNSAQNLTVGGYGRFSLHEEESVIPNFTRWLSFTLTGDGSPPSDNRDIVDMVLSTPVTSLEILQLLERASRDSSVGGVVLRLGGISLNWGRLQELHRLLLNIRKADKKVVVHLDSGGDAEMFLASAADRVYISPAASIALDGVSTQLVYVKTLFDQLGIEAEAITAGEYKSAPRTFTADGPNAAELEVSTNLVEKSYQNLVMTIATGRGLAPGVVRKLIDDGGQTADEAVKNKLVDGICYFDDITDKIRDTFSDSFFGELDADYIDEGSVENRWDTSDQIAVIPVIGGITMSSQGGVPFLGGTSGAAADVLIGAIDRAADDSDIRAVVLRIDSPGGDALASDLIWNAVMRLRAKKPVVVSMGDVAASGGYYIAAAGHKIYAESQTLTGSIGVFALSFNAAKLAQDLGVSTHEISRGKNPGGNMLRRMTDSEKQSAQRQVNWIYDRFLTAISQGRSTKKSEILPLAGGRVWTGAEAKQNGLVDDIGGMHDALVDAARRAGIELEDSQVVYMGSEDSASARVKQAVSVAAGSGAAMAAANDLAKMFTGIEPDVIRMFATERPLALSPILFQ